MYTSRMSNLQTVLKQQSIDALLVTRFFDILYLTGFKTLSPSEREAYVLVTNGNTYVFSDGRYFSDSQDYTFTLLEPNRGLVAHLREIVRKEKIKKMGFQKEDLKWNEYDALSKAMKLEFVPQDNLILMLRSQKKEEEIKKIKKACSITDKCLKDIVKTIHIGMSEKEIAWRMEKWVREKGAEFAFDPIVAVDENAAVPHYDTKKGHKKLTANSIILIDFGVRYEDYNSDITRMFFTGRQPDGVMRVYETLLKAQEKAVANLEASRACSDIDAYCRNLLAESNLPNYPHSTGHGIGLEVHEYPKLSSVSNETLRKGNVITVEPGVYIRGEWGMRIEDTVCINSKGRGEVLTKFPKSFYKI